MLKLIPFRMEWVEKTEIDIHAIYRRPRWTTDKYGDRERELDPKTQRPTWDLTGPLPVKQHNVWIMKGYEYVTLADKHSLATAVQHQTIDGDWRQYNQHRETGPWNYRLYLEGQETEAAAGAQRVLDDEAQLAADVAEFGWQAVEKIRRRGDPAFAVPAHLKEAKAEAKAAEKAKGKDATA